MGMVITPESELGKEMARWNKPYVYHAFPAMMYKALRRDEDGVVVVRGNEQINQKCQKVVNDEYERNKALEMGWRQSPEEAVELLKALESKRGVDAAHRNYEDRNMSEAAKAEAAEFEGDSPEHVPEIPVAPKKRKRKRLED